MYHFGILFALALNCWSVEFHKWKNGKGLLIGWRGSEMEGRWEVEKNNCQFWISRVHSINDGSIFLTKKMPVHFIMFNFKVCTIQRMFFFYTKATLKYTTGRIWIILFLSVVEMTIFFQLSKWQFSTSAFVEDISWVMLPPLSEDGGKLKSPVGDSRVGW